MVFHILGFKLVDLFYTKLISVHIFSESIKEEFVGADCLLGGGAAKIPYSYLHLWLIYLIFEVILPIGVKQILNKIYGGGTIKWSGLTRIKK